MTDARIRISTVIPAFNREKTVGRAIESALAQSHAPDEIVVVDDGSDDGTLAVAQSFGERVRCIPQDNAGAPAARNRGLREARCPWAALLDSDDHWDAGHLERMAAAIAGTRGEAVLYFADTRRTKEDGEVRQWTRAKFSAEGPFSLVRDGTPWVVRERIPMMLQSSVFHRAGLLAAGGLWEALRMRDDTHVFLKLGIGGAICAVEGLGAVMTADDQSGGRLTTAAGNRTKVYWEYSVLMWSDLLDRFPDLAGAPRAELERRLALAHLRLARFLWHERSLSRAAAHVLRSVRAHPAQFLSSVVGFARKPRA